MRVVISSGHGLKIRGASGILDEVDEARKVVDHVAGYLQSSNHDVIVFHDNTSTTQDQNLKTIVNFHNSQKRDFDVSVHFNAYQSTSKPMGTEVLYVTQQDVANRISAAISVSGELINRGPKKRTDLYFLNKTDKPAVLIEVCFVDSSADAQSYRSNFDRICMEIAAVAGGPVVPNADFDGKCSWFGGPKDMGVSPSEGLAFIYELDTAPNLFLPAQPPGTTGLARRLDPEVFYIACRWDYNVTSKEMLASSGNMAKVFAPKSGLSFEARPADWGPHTSTNRVADLSPGLLKALRIETDDIVQVTYPSGKETPQEEEIAGMEEAPPPPKKKPTRPKKSHK